MARLFPHAVLQQAFPRFSPGAQKQDMIIFGYSQELTKVACRFPIDILKVGTPMGEGEYLFPHRLLKVLLRGKIKSRRSGGKVKLSAHKQ